LRFPPLNRRSRRLGRPLLRTAKSVKKVDLHANASESGYQIKILPV
jgi:hypothetical protein